MIVCIGHHCIGIACYSRWCCDVHRLQSHDHIFTCICMSATCSLGLGSLSIEHPTVHSVWAAWQLLKFVPQHIGFVLNCGMAHVVPPLMLVACLQLAFITCSLDMQPFSGGLFFFLKTNRHHCLESLLPSFTFLWSSQTGMSLSSCLDSWSSLSGRKLSVHTQTTWQTLFIFCLCAWTSFVCYFDTVVSSQSGMGLGWEFYHGHLHWNILPSGLDWPLFTLSLASHACHPRLGWLWGSGTCLPCLVIFCSCTIDAHYTCWLSRIVTFCSALFVSWLSFLSSQTGMTWFSMSDNTIHPSLGWAQHIRASQIYQK